MNPDQFPHAKIPAVAMRWLSAPAQARHTALQRDEHAWVSAPDESGTRRSVRTAASLSVMIPVAIIVVMIGSASWRMPAAVGAVTTPAIEVSPALGTAEAEYYPGKFVNQARVAEDHVQNF